MRSTLLAAAVAVLVVPASANAAFSSPIDSPRVERAQAAAVAHFDRTPTCGAVSTVKAETEDLADPSLFYDVAALDPEWAGVGDPIFCRIYLRRTYLKPRPSWRSFCVLYVHEFGHVLGLDHSDNVRSVMHLPPLRTPRVCRSVR